MLVAVSLAASMAIGIPLGVLAARRPLVGQGVLAVVGVIHTIPALALLAFLVAALGTIGTLPALVALSLYALLPLRRRRSWRESRLPPLSTSALLPSPP